MPRTIDRRTFLGALAAGTATLLLPRLSLSQEPAAPDTPQSAHHAAGRRVGVTSSSAEATDAALSTLSQGGNAADAYLAAALTQTVVEPGLTTIGGALGMFFFRASTGKTESALGRLGPAAAESYDYERFSPASRTGRGLPVPGFLAGCRAAHERFGKQPWAKLFQPAIGHALSGVVVPDAVLRLAERSLAQSPEGRAIWTKDGRFLRPGEKLVQTELGRTLSAVARGGPEAFYEGEFARAYVKRARADGGRLTMKDMQGWHDFATTRACELDGSYRGHRVCAPRAGLLTYALHLTEALDLRATGPAVASPESVFRQIRILEEVFLSTKAYSEETHDRYVSPDYATERADFVLKSPIREVRIDDLFNTCFLVVRDDRGTAPGEHTPSTRRRPSARASWWPASRPPTRSTAITSGGRGRRRAASLPRTRSSGKGSPGSSPAPLASASSTAPTRSARA
jgi:gamma-glutamyltranspeptidase